MAEWCILVRIYAPRSSVLIAQILYLNMTRVTECIFPCTLEDCQSLLHLGLDQHFQKLAPAFLGRYTTKAVPMPPPLNSGFEDARVCQVISTFWASG